MSSCLSDQASNTAEDTKSLKIQSSITSSSPPNEDFADFPVAFANFLPPPKTSDFNQAFFPNPAFPENNIKPIHNSPDNFISNDIFFAQFDDIDFKNQPAAGTFKMGKKSTSLFAINIKENNSSLLSKIVRSKSLNWIDLKNDDNPSTCEQTEIAEKNDFLDDSISQELKQDQIRKDDASAFFANTCRTHGIAFDNSLNAESNAPLEVEQTKIEFEIGRLE